MYATPRREKAGARLDVIPLRGLPDALHRGSAGQYPALALCGHKEGGGVDELQLPQALRIDTTVVRYFTVFGPAGRPDMSVFRFIKWIDEGKPLERFGDGTQSRDFAYVDDIARGTILAGMLRGYDGARQRGDGMIAGHAPNAGLEAGEVVAGGNPEGVNGYNIVNFGGGRKPDQSADRNRIHRAVIGQAGPNQRTGAPPRRHQGNMGRYLKGNSTLWLETKDFNIRGPRSHDKMAYRKSQVALLHHALNSWQSNH